MPASNGSVSWTRWSWNVGLHMGPFVQSYIRDVGIRTTYRKKWVTFKFVYVVVAHWNNFN
jgi:hypothetical protein